MIVTLHISLANRHKTLDPDMRIKVTPRTLSSGQVVYKVMGSQLLIAGVHTVGGYAVIKEQDYLLLRSSIVPVCYHVVTLSDNVPESLLPDRTYRMRVQGYDREGYPLLLISDLKKCMIVRSVALYRSPEMPGCIPVKPSMVRFC